jgi:hypothetical protein
MYEHIKKSELERGESVERAKQIAAMTVNARKKKKGK